MTLSGHDTVMAGVKPDCTRQVRHVDFGDRAWREAAMSDEIKVPILLDRARDCPHYQNATRDCRGDVMSLAAVASDIAQSPDDDWTEKRLRGLLSNMLASLSQNHVQIDGLKRRLRKVIEQYNLDDGQRNRVALLAAIQIAVDDAGEADYYGRPQQLTDQLDCRAVTIQADGDGACGEYWLGYPADAKVIAERFAVGACSGPVGAPNRALWIAPYHGALKALCEEASSPSLPSRRRADIVVRIVEKLGLCHFRNGEGILAFVTAKTIRELTFEHPVSKATCAPVGSTILEARTNPRFRTWPWPQTVGPDSYGRTYDLDPRERTACNPRLHHGAPEAIRPRLEMTYFNSCIYLGVLSKGIVDDDDAYLDEIGATYGSVDLLRALAAAVHL